MQCVIKDRVCVTFWCVAEQMPLNLQGNLIRKEATVYKMTIVITAAAKIDRGNKIGVITIL